MTDEPFNLVLEHLRAIRAENAKTHEELRDIKGRVSNVEIFVGAVVTADGRMQHSIDRLGERLDRIERRLDLVDEAPLL
jgi:hypothetical protein